LLGIVHTLRQAQLGPFSSAWELQCPLGTSFST
jgi:hypothetical protein